MSTGRGAQRRRDERYKVNLPISLVIGSSQIDAFTEDVSFRGLFVRTDQPAELRQLLVVEAKLPPDDFAFHCHGMAVFVIQPGDPSGRAPGMGIQFYAMGDGRRSWESYINTVRDLQKENIDVGDLVEPIR